MDPFVFESWEEYITLQGAKSPDLEETYDFISSSRKVIKPVYAHEVLWYGNMYHSVTDTESFRKKAITLIMAGAFINLGDMNGNSSSGFSGCLDPDSANTEIHDAMARTWNIFDNLPFFELSPAPDEAEGALCLADGAGSFLAYSPEGKRFRLNISVPVSGRWINPRNPGEKHKDEFFPDQIINPPDLNDWLLWISGNNE